MEPYFTQQLISYIGNKRKLLGFIEEAIIDVKQQLGNQNVTILDAFAGSGSVSRMAKQHCTKIISNDLEAYASVIGECYLANRSEIDRKLLAEVVDQINANRFYNNDVGLIRQLYAPADDTDIKTGERAFYTNKNAQIIDNIRRNIDGFDSGLRSFLLAPLLYEASVKVNTSGVFKGFYKDSNTSLGRFGGNGENALDRILAEITLPIPVFSPRDSEWEVHCRDANELVKEVEVDIAYFDPPYNQHPYGSNYFMLNVINEYTMPLEISKVSGIPKEWNRSSYNKKSEVSIAIRNLIHDTNAKYFIMSYNDEGYVSEQEMIDIINSEASLVDIRKKDYPTFRGSRNLKNRSKNVAELLFVFKK